jgi:hypothetical protein
MEFAFVRADPVGKAGQACEQHEIGAIEASFGWDDFRREDRQQCLEDGAASLMPFGFAECPAVAGQAVQCAWLGALAVMTADSICCEHSQFLRPSQIDQ